MMLLSEAALLFTTNICAHVAGVPGCSVIPVDQGVKEEVVSAVVSVTQDAQEVETLLRIARWESGGFRRDIASCRVRGDSGEARGIWQVHGIGAQEKYDLCSPDLSKQARVALAHVRGSARTCGNKGYRGHQLLGEYVSGQCGRGNEASRLRWGSGEAIQRLLFTEDNLTVSKRNIILEESDGLALFPVREEKYN